MHNTSQTKNQSVLQHGLSVQRYTFDLLYHLKYNTPLKYEWKLPDWIYSEKEFILNNLTSEYNLSLYTKLHDIGKPKCLTIDCEGKNHFPNHAQISYEVFTSLFDNEEVGELILNDMDIHLLKSENLLNFINKKNCVTSLFVGLAEIHSNATMFGEIDSVSFKIKQKHITQKGKQIINNLKNKQNNGN